MATLILTAVGTAIGGPIGGALGALAGQAIDSAVFKPKGREGPRLTELAVQTSSYGSPIPQLFGTMRVAGTVIWSTDLIERSSSEGGGKGRGATTSYAYFASFAVLLSARPIVSVGRIWADGKLLRGGAGDLKTPVDFRLHTGGPDQATDPLIASAEGVALTPALRGQAYAVFENMALVDYGNHIPSLTFEVVADDGPVTCGGVAEAVSAGLVSGANAPTVLGGYSAYGDSLRGVIDGLASASGAWFANAAGGLALRSGAGAAAEIVDERIGGRGKRAIAAADTAPRLVTLQHYDPARDYQTGLQRAARPGAGNRIERIELPAALAAGAAKTLAGAALTRLDVERERRTVALDWRAIDVGPGDRVTIAGEGGLWRVSGWNLEGMALTLELVRIARATAPAVATPGRVIGAPDALAGATILHAFECPPIDDAVLGAPQLTIAAAGTGAGWRTANLQLSSDGGMRWTPIGSTRGRAVLGWVAIPPGSAPSTLVDRCHAIEVTLGNEAMVLADADAAAIDAGANLAIVGDELIQFGRAEQIGPARWRLSELWRGRRGTEWAAGGTSSGDRFVLLDPATLVQVALPLATLGGSVEVVAAGPGDGDSPIGVTAAIAGGSILPPSPVHLSATPATGGALALRWVRRSRGGWRWIDGVDAPLGEEAERYRIDLIGSGIVAPSSTTFGPSALVEAVDLADVDAIEVRMSGIHGFSRPTAISIPD